MQMSSEMSQLYLLHMLFSIFFKVLRFLFAGALCCIYLYQNNIYLKEIKEDGRIKYPQSHCGTKFSFMVYLDRVGDVKDIKYL